MDIEKMKALIDEQQKLVSLELQATGQGYVQALNWVKTQLLKEETPK